MMQGNLSGCDEFEQGVLVAGSWGEGPESGGDFTLLNKPEGLQVANRSYVG
jgi:hypothetical protein